jgi:hypothetical protein
VLELLEDQHGGALGWNHAVANGRLARSGSSLRCESARIEQNEARPVSQIEASVPPAIMTSAAPRRIASDASPIACAPAAQAVMIVEE